MSHFGGDVGNEGGCAYVGLEGMWEVSILPAQFLCEPKTTIKIIY